MRLGRNFTNLLEHDFLSDRMKKAFAGGTLTVADMDATVLVKWKADVARQVGVARETGHDHVELDGGIPNPYLRIRPKAVDEARAAAEAAKVTLSLHLPYTFVAEATCGFQEEDRKIACRYLKRYLDVAGRLGCAHAVMHPGSIPPYQAAGKYLEAAGAALEKSLVDLGTYALSKGVPLHLENNTRWDPVFVTPAQVVPLLERVNAKGAGVKFCFDLAHTFTLVEKTEQIPLPPEAPYESIPAGLYDAVHVGDFLPERGLFHPPLHREAGLMKEANWRNAFRTFRRKGVRTVVVETAVRERDDLVKGRQILEAETAYVRKILDEVMREPAPVPESAPSLSI